MRLSLWTLLVAVIAIVTASAYRAVAQLDECADADGTTG